ncbi:MAG: hypothetical protein RL535_926, partial [Pseudomonadota bacterium]
MHIGMRPQRRCHRLRRLGCYESLAHMQRAGGEQHHAQHHFNH